MEHSTSPSPKDMSDLNFNELNRLMDIAKSIVFRSDRAAFFGPLMSRLQFIWTPDIKTAATDGVTFTWNPYWFLKIPAKTRPTIIMHELWHVARLHMLRCGTRNPIIWNYACDIRINNDLEKEGYSFEGTRPWLDHSFDSKERQPEEDIYDTLMQMGDDKLALLLLALGDSWSGEPPEDEDDEDIGDMQGINVSPITGQDIIASVVAARHQATLSGCAGQIPGEVQTVLNQFLAPIIPWETKLHKFFYDLIEEDYAWTRPNRRMLDILYLPSRYEDEGRLDHLIYYFDVSGSVTDAQAVRFNSEVKYIWDVLQPKKLTLAQFDTKIQDEKVFLQGDPFDEIVIVGRGGTDLAPVREHMIENKPTAAIIFSDLWCDPMEALPFDIPTIWVAINNTSTEIPFGERINIRA